MTLKEFDKICFNYQPVKKLKEYKEKNPQLFSQNLNSLLNGSGESTQTGMLHRAFRLSESILDEYRLTEIIEYLINEGADIEQYDGQGNHLVHIAVQQTKPFLLEILIKHGVKTRIANYDGIYPLDIINARLSDNSTLTPESTYNNLIHLRDLLDQDQYPHPVDTAIQTEGLTEENMDEPEMMEGAACMGFWSNPN